MIINKMSHMQIKSAGILLIVSMGIMLFSFKERHANPDRVVILQPFDDFSPALANVVYKQIRILHPQTILKKPIGFPNGSYYRARGRYRADSIIHYLNRFGNSDTVIIGLTGKDISTTKGNIKDWGVMGLGYCPGNACVVSAFRLKKTNLSIQFYKVAIHELGHTQGLPHCKKKTCFMRDAEGGNHLDEETDFCVSCKSFLKRKGWIVASTASQSLAGTLASQ